MPANLNDEFDQWFNMLYDGMNLDPVAYRELKRAWFSGQLVILIEFLKLSELPDLQGVRAIEVMRKQIMDNCTQLAQSR